MSQMCNPHTLWLKFLISLKDQLMFCRGKPQLDKLLSLVVEASAEGGFLPSLLAVFAAEAALVVTQPGASITRAVEKFLNGSEKLALDVSSLFGPLPIDLYPLHTSLLPK